MVEWRNAGDVRDEGEKTMKLTVNILAIAIILTCVSTCKITERINILEQRIQTMEQKYDGQPLL